MAMPAPGQPGEINLGMYHYGSDGSGAAGGGQLSGSSGVNQSSSSSQSSTYIPDYLESPILRQIAQYSSQMAPQVYQWGMEQFNKNQGNIDAMLRNALSYGSQQRVSSEMGKAQAGVMRGAETGRQNAIRDLQSYGIDPSSGRYAALDKANQVMAGAAAAGAGNMQRDVVQKTAGEMQTQAQQLSNQNVQTGYGASAAMKGLLDTGMSLKFPPLGQTASSSGSSSGNTSSFSMPANLANTSLGMQHFAGGGDVDQIGYAPEGGDPTTGGFVSQELSPSAGSQTDDVSARLNAGEFVIPKDVAEWKGQEFFYKLMAQARKMRATAGQENGDANSMMAQTGYGADESAQAPAFGS